MRPAFPSLAVVAFVSCTSLKQGHQSTKSLQTMSPSDIELTEFLNATVIYQPPPPSFPVQAMNKGIQGVVSVELIVGPDGVPISAKALEGPSEYRQTAEDYLMKYRFACVYRDGKAQPMRFRLNLPFKAIHD